MAALAQPIPNTAALPRATLRGRPLLPLQGAISALDLSKDQIGEMADDGRLLYVWDLALELNNSRRRLFRFLPDCCEDVAAGRASQLEWEDVMRLLIPQSAEVLSANYLYHILNISETFFYALVQRREMATLSGWRAGPGGSARIPRQSFEAFLKRRRYGAAADGASPASVRPMLPIFAAAQALSLTKDEVLGLVEQGKIQFVFDVEPNPELGKRRGLRFLPLEIESRARGADCGLEFNDVLSLILPEGQEAPRAADICRALAISPEQLDGFLNRQELAIVPDPTRRPGTPPRISTESIANFLRRRRYPSPGEPG